jgi:hypothetical protein
MSTANGKVAALTVTFSDEAYETLRELMERTGRTADEVLSEALALERKAIEAKQSGGRVLIERQGRRSEVQLNPA